MPGKETEGMTQAQGSAEGKLEALASDTSPGEGAAVLRESARLQLENRRLKKQILRVWVAVGFVSAGFVISLYAVLAWFPKFRYIPTTNNAAICEASTEAEPRVSAADITDYAKDAVLHSYSYDYVNYRTTINEAALRWYTDTGRKAFMQGLDDSGNLKRVISGHLTLRSMATRTPQLEEAGHDGITRYWNVIVPIAIEFFAGGAEKPLSRQEFRATVKVVQTPASATNLKGIAVESVVLAPGRG